MPAITRRTLIGQAGAAGALALSGASAFAQSGTDWPDKPIRLIVNFAPGGGSDNAARPFGDRLTRLLGQQVIIENRGGASGVIGAEAVIKSAPDGYTFLATPSLTLVVVPHLRKISFDPLKDLVPVASFVEGTLLIAVHASVPANSLQELAAYAKANPGKLSWATPGVGTFGHIICETFKHHAGVDILHVPYRGTGDAMNDFLAGNVHIQADPITLPHVAAGKAKLLGVFGRERRPDYPNVPIVKEVFPQMDYSVWFGLFAPVGTPPGIIGRMSEALNKVVAEPDLRQVFFPLAMTPVPSTPAETAALTKSDFEKYGAIIRQFNIKAE